MKLSSEWRVDIENSSVNFGNIGIMQYLLTSYYAAIHEMEGWRFNTHGGFGGIVTNCVRPGLVSVLGSPRANLLVVGMLRFMSDINQPSLPTPIYSVLESVSVFMGLSTVFHAINSPSNSPLSHSVLPVLILPYCFFQLYVSL